jgi:serine/threonine-protein kinase HipA
MISQRDRLHIGAGGALVGTLGRSENNLRDSVFVYNETVNEDQAVSLTMPVRLESYKWEYGIHPLFEMHIPEGHLKDALMRRFSRRRAVMNCSVRCTLG